MAREVDPVAALHACRVQVGAHPKNPDFVYIKQDLAVIRQVGVTIVSKAAVPALIEQLQEAMK